MFVNFLNIVLDGSKFFFLVLLRHECLGFYLEVLLSIVFAASLTINLLRQKMKNKVKTFKVKWFRLF